jgi:serine protease Do
MKRLFAIPFISALVGGGVVVAVLAASGSLSSSNKTVTEVQAAAPVSTSATASSSNEIPTRSGGGGGLSAHAIYERTAPSVVEVTSTIVRQSESPFGFGETEQQGTATGSGFVIDSNGTLLTNWHVVENASKVIVHFEHSKTVEAHVVGKNPSQDLAVLKIPTEGLNLHPLALGDSSGVEVGEPVVAIPSASAER